MFYKPTRVLVEPNYGVPYDRALREYKTVPDVIFVRHDGWSLGAPKRLLNEAYWLHRNEWISYCFPTMLRILDIDGFLDLHLLPRYVDRVFSCNANIQIVLTSKPKVE
jgi:hypothetical protein